MLPGFLYRPSGAGPFPAMVHLHGCTGIVPPNFHWAEVLQAKGYVALIVDSFSPRHIRDACPPSGGLSLRRAGDAIGALAYLRSLPYVEADHIGVMGWSSGGATTLLVGRQEIIDKAHISGGGFRAAVAIYPLCEYMNKDIRIPLLLVLGSRDDSTPPQYCQDVAKEMQQEGRITLVQVFGVYHGFDAPGSTTPHKTPQGITIAYDPVATQAAENVVETFLALHLR